MIKYRKINGALAFMFTLVFCITWSIGVMMEFSATSLHAKFFWARITFPSYAFGPLAWIIMVLQLTDLWHKWCKPKKLILLCTIPAITALISWSGDPYHLIWKSVYIYKQGLVHPIISVRGIWFWVHSIYSDFINIISIVLLIWFWKRKAPHYKRQLEYLLYSQGFVIFINALHVLKKWPVYDTTPIAWGLSSIFVFKSLFGEKLFDLVPIARNRIMESMEDSIVVFDLKNRVEDINSSSKDMFGCGLIKKIGCKVDVFFEGWPELIQLVENEIEHTEFQRVQKKETRFYEASKLPIKNDREILLGSLVVIRDVTEKVSMTRELLLKQQEISTKVEREKLARDLHDNFGQILAFVNVQTQAIKENLKRGQTKTAIELLDSLTEVTQQSQNTVRQTILSMMQEAVTTENSEIDFIAELNRQISSMEKHFNIRCEINYKLIDSHKVLDSVIWKQVENIIKETLNNIIKHSKAKNVKILFEELKGELNITVIDDGCGFDINSLSDKHHGKYGLLFMQERAQEFQGHVSISSAIGIGTTVKITIPVREIKQDFKMSLKPKSQEPIDILKL